MAARKDTRGQSAGREGAQAIWLTRGSLANSHLPNRWGAVMAERRKPTHRT